MLANPDIDRCFKREGVVTDTDSRRKCCNWYSICSHKPAFFQWHQIPALDFLYYPERHHMALLWSPHTAAWEVEEAVESDLLQGCICHPTLSVRRKDTEISYRLGYKLNGTTGKVVELRHKQASIIQTCTEWAISIHSRSDLTLPSIKSFLPWSLSAWPW